MTKHYILTELEYYDWDECENATPSMTQNYFSNTADFTRYIQSLSNVSIPISVELTKNKENFLVDFQIQNAELKKFAWGHLSAKDLSDNALKIAQEIQNNALLRFLLPEEKIIELNTAIHDKNEASSKQEIAKRTKALELKLKREAARKQKLEEELQILKGAL